MNIEEEAVDKVIYVDDTSDDKEVLPVAQIDSSQVDTYHALESSRRQAKKEKLKDRKPKREKRKKPRCAPRHLLKRMFGAIGRGFVKAFSAVAGFFTKVGELLSMALCVITIISAVLSFACAMFSFIFPCNNVLMYEYNYELWLGFTIAAGSFAFLTIVFSIAHSCHRRSGKKGVKITLDNWLVSIICSLVTLAFALLGLLVGGFKHTMYGWGIAVICVGGVSSLVAIFSLIDDYYVYASFTALAVCSVTIALCGVTYMVTEQPIGYVKADNGMYYVIREDNTLTVYAADYDVEELVIPSEIDGYRVTAIMRPKVTSKSGKLKKVTIPDSVLFIENETFKGCTGLEAITLPDNVRVLGARAFYGCRSLSSVTFNDELKTIGESAFENCISLTSATLPENISTIPKRAFKGCAKLTTVTVGAKTVGIEAFANCSALNDVTLLDGIETIDTLAFANDILLKDIYIPLTAKTMKPDSFKRCISLTLYVAHEKISDLILNAFDGNDVVLNVTRSEYEQIISASKES